MKSKILSMLILASAGMLLQTAFCEDRSKLDELKKDFRSFRIRAADREAKRGYLLEPLLPFDEAADKAKRGYPQGYYALALHYAKGVEIERDAELARQFLQKADSANYGNAVFVLAMLNELELFGDLSHRSLLMHDSDAVGIAKYIGVPVDSYKGMLSFTNKTDVALVRTGYERAINLGISVATNELARFERRLVKELAKADQEAYSASRIAAVKARNSEIAKSTLGLLPALPKAKETSNAFSKALPRKKIIMTPEMLEPMIPLDEALQLAKQDKGKGYYQLAIRYAQGNELPEDRCVAYKLLRKACDANYANAILVEGLCDEADLRECIPDSKILRPAEVTSWMRGYCGTIFCSGRHGWDILTNEVAFARIMSKYARAKDLGLFEATNHIARLNNRLANFKKEDAERNAKEKVKSENNSRVLSLLGDIAVTSEASAENGERQTVVDANSRAFLDNLHPAHIAIGMPSNFPEGSLVDNSPGTTSDLWSFYSSGMSGNGFRLLVITRITSPADYERNLHYAVATISAAGNIISVGPELGSINIYGGIK